MAMIGKTVKLMPILRTVNIFLLKCGGLFIIHLHTNKQLFKQSQKT